jgi:hypothetical protein
MKTTTQPGLKGLQKYLDVHDFEPIDYENDSHDGPVHYKCIKCGISATGHSDYTLGEGVSPDSLKMCPP